MRSRVQTITPARAAEWLEANTTNRPLSRPVVRSFAEAMRRGEWLVTHQGIAFDVNGVLVDGQHRLAAIIEADLPVQLTVFREVAEGTFDVLDTVSAAPRPTCWRSRGRRTARCSPRWCAPCGSIATGRS